MCWLLGGIAFLIAGYFTYGKLIEKFILCDFIFKHIRNLL